MAISTEAIGIAKKRFVGHTGWVTPTEHGSPAEGGLLDVFWSDRRADEFDEGCRCA